MAQDVNLGNSLVSASRGFRMVGAAAEDNSGSSVRAAGDVNNDGIGDVIVGAKFADPTSGNEAGVVYVIFGRNVAGGASPFADLQLTNGAVALPPGAGFRILGAAAGDQCGFSVSAAGDVNKDGIDDVIIGASGADPPGLADAGISYVIFGRNITEGTSAFDDIQLTTGAMSASVGFRILGAANGDLSGGSVRDAGDVNGDGIDDVMIGAQGGDTTGGIDTGIYYVIFGRNIPGGAAPFGDVQLTTTALLASVGFRILGAAANDNGVVSAAGDVNGDGIGDVMVGAMNADPPVGANAGIVYVIFGRKVVNVGAFGDVLLTTGSTALAPGTGFRILGAATGDLFGHSVGAAGDVNGDGIGDLVVGAISADAPGGVETGIAYVIFGRSLTAQGLNPFVDIQLTTSSTPMPASLGFRVFGVGGNDQCGYSVSAAGDVNGDHIGDIIVSAILADVRDTVAASNDGISYVIYGRATLSGDIQLSNGFTAMSASTGFRILGPNGGARVGNSVSAAGDVNGDGIGDVIVGSVRAAQPIGTNAGISYVVYGMDLRPTSQPSVQPTSQPSRQLSRQPSSQPSRQPSAQPSRQPSAQPTTQPVARPSSQPSIQPSRQPSTQPTLQPSRQPSRQPSSQPTNQPSIQPTKQPSTQPTSPPSAQPTLQPSRQPSRQPSSQPTNQPSIQPTKQPSTQPTRQPSTVPTSQPSTQPSRQPSSQPTRKPTAQPSSEPSTQPTTQPVALPSSQPSIQPSNQPSVHPCPSAQPSSQPSSRPSTQPLSQPSSFPSTQPSSQPSSNPSAQPSSQPSSKPSTQPSSQPSSFPSTQPSAQPSSSPSAQPSSQPSIKPSTHPSSQPSSRPSTQPSSQPISSPSAQPSSFPSAQPSAQPLSNPSAQPSSQPSSKPSTQPSSQPSAQPSAGPSTQPSKQPSSQPVRRRTGQPSGSPTGGSGSVPIAVPSNQPSVALTAQPSQQPTIIPTISPTSQPTSDPTERSFIPGEWSSALVNTSMITGGFSVINQSIWTCGVDNRVFPTGSYCAIVDAIDGTQLILFSFPWSAITSVSQGNEATGVRLSGVIARSASASAEVAICQIGDGNLLCTALSFEDTTAVAGSYATAVNKIVYIGEYNAHALAIIVDNAATAATRSYLYSSSIMKDIAFSHIESPPNYVGSFVAGTCVSSGVAGMVAIFAGMVRTDSGVMTAMYVSTISGNIVNRDELVNTMALEYTNPDSFIAGGLQLADDAPMHAYMLCVNSIHRKVLYGVRYVRQGTLNGSRRRAQLNQNTENGASVVTGMVLVDNFLYMIVSYQELHGTPENCEDYW